MTELEQTQERVVRLTAEVEKQIAAKNRFMDGVEEIRAQRTAVEGELRKAEMEILRLRAENRLLEVDLGKALNAECAAPPGGEGEPMPPQKTMPIRFLGPKERKR